MTQYSIKDLEKLSGIKAHTIRIWEKRYNLLSPNRSDTNIRNYCDEDLKKILNVSSLVKSGLKISKVATLCNESMKKEILKLEEKHLDPNNKIDQLIRLMINFSTEGFQSTLDKTFVELGAEKTFTEIIFSFLERIGVLWQVGSIFPAHEHFVSNLIRNKLIAETYKLKKKPSSKTILFFLKEDEWHELGLLFFNYIAIKNGFNTVYLGPNLPIEDLQEINDKYKFDYIASSFVNALSEDQLNSYLKKISGIFQEKTILISGFQVTNLQPELPDNMIHISSIEDFTSKLTA